MRIEPTSISYFYAPVVTETSDLRPEAVFQVRRERLRKAQEEMAARIESLLWAGESQIGDVVYGPLPTRRDRMAAAVYRLRCSVAAPIQWVSNLIRGWSYVDPDDVERDW